MGAERREQTRWQRWAAEKNGQGWAWYVAEGGRATCRREGMFLVIGMGVGGRGGYDAAGANRLLVTSGADQHTAKVSYIRNKNILVKKKRKETQFL